MANILTQAQALNALRRVTIDEVPELPDLMGAVDDQIKSATGHDWAADAVTDPTAYVAARLLLIHLYFGSPLLDFYTGAITQLDGKVKNGEATNDAVYGGAV
jgi:hypothetical protein